MAGASTLRCRLRLVSPGRQCLSGSVRGGRLAVSQTGHVAGMLLREYDPNAHGTFGAGPDPRVAVWTLDDDQLIGLIKVATDALAIRRRIRGR